jgi:endoglucanase
MTWQVPIDPAGDDSAFDGDADIAYALLLADRQWGSKGAVAYRREAEQVMRAILRSTIGPRSHLPMLGDWTSPDGERHNQFPPRPSDCYEDALNLMSLLVMTGSLSHPAVGRHQRGER